MCCGSFVNHTAAIIYRRYVCLISVQLARMKEEFCQIVEAIVGKALWGADITVEEMDKLVIQIDDSSDDEEPNTDDEEPNSSSYYDSRNADSVLIYGVARMLNRYAYQRETTRSSNDSFNYVPFQMGTSLKGKNLLPEGAKSFLYEQFLIVWKITFDPIKVTSLECYYF